MKGADRLFRLGIIKETAKLCGTSMLREESGTGRSASARPYGMRQQILVLSIRKEQSMEELKSIMEKFAACVN